MDLSTILVGLALLAIMLIPFYFVNQKRKGKVKKEKENFELLVNRAGVNPSNYEIIGNLMLGLDKDAKKVFFTDKRNIEGNFQVLDLNDYQSCSAKSTGPNKTQLQWVGIEFQGKEEVKNISFYDDNDEEWQGQGPFSLQQDARRWASEIRQVMKV